MEKAKQLQVFYIIHTGAFICYECYCYIDARRVVRLCISPKFGGLLDSDKMAKAKILVVEDEAITARDIQNRLKELDYDVPAIAASGEGAIKSVEEIEPDLVVMDLILKGDMDGIEAAEQIHDRFDVPVVYVTASLDEARLEKTKVTEPYGYIIKPFEDKELRPVIEMALQRHKLEKVLRTAEQDWRNSFNSLEDVMLIVDRDYNIENLNESGLKLLGKSKEEVIGQKCYQVISGMDSPGEDCPCMKSLETKKVESFDRYEEVFGKYYSIKCSPIFDENGEIIKFVDLRRDITERTHLMMGRDNSLKFLEAIIENIPDAVYLKDSQYRYSLVNQAYCDLFEVKKEEIIRKERVYETDKEIFQTGKAVEIQEQSFTDHKGKRHYTHLKKVPLIDNSGNVTHVLTISRDITERKNAEEKLRLFSQATDSSIEGIAMGNLEGMITYVNETFIRMFGYSREELIGREIPFIYAEDQLPKLEEALKATMEGGWTGELVGKRKNGELFPMAISASRVVDNEGNVVAHMASQQDITERKRAEKALWESEERLDLAVKGTGVGLWDWMVQTGETVFNERWAKIVGYTLEALSPVSIETWITLTHPDDLKRSNELLERHFAGETEYYESETRLKHKSGEWIWVLDRGKVFEWDKDGKPIRMIGTHQDITERKRAEEELKKKNEELRRFNKLAVGRELRMIELKKEINALLEDLGKEPLYRIAGEV